MRRQRVSRTVQRGGFTLIELLIAITLLGAVVTGMMVALRNGMLTLDRIDDRLETNRRAVGIDTLLHNQIAAAIPANGDCSGARAPVFRGTAEAMLLVSSYSMNSGARGYPNLLYYRVLPDGPGFRLVVDEIPFYGPGASNAFCSGREGLQPIAETPRTFTVARGLAYARFEYQRQNPLTGFGLEWLPAWETSSLPMAIRIDMAPARPQPDAMPLLSLTVPLRITRVYGESYADE